MSWRIRSVRKRILLLVLVPVLSLFGLYVFTTSITGREALNLARARTLTAATTQPVGNFLGQLDTERVFALTYLSAPSHGNLAKLRAAEARTNEVTAALRAALTAGSVTKNASAGERQASATLLNAASRLPALHSSINARSTSRSRALAAYGALIGDSYLLFNQVILAENSAPIVAQALGLERMSKSAELLQQENVLLVADMAGRKFPLADQQAFTQLVGARRTLSGQTLSELDPVYRAIWQQATSSGAYPALTSLENAVIGNAHPGALPVGPISWQRAVQGVSLGFERAAAQASGALGQRAEREARATDRRLLLSGGLGLLAVLASIVVSLLIGRGLVRELRALRLSALELANDRLPKVVDQLSAGMDIEVPSEPPGPPAKSSEIGQVREAFAKVQQMAVQAAVGQARLREGISEVFRNLARRSQSLLHRQLALLDGMERRAKDPQELEDLFRIDHLTTRMRRHAESLIILSGQAPARGWRNPVPLVDVLRAAVAEVEDYTRVRVVCATDAALAGPAVGDVIHMLAEIVENATIFSPPSAPVVINGDIVGQGFAVEIEDRGLGLSEQRLAEINDRLEHPPPFDPASTDQLGLFVAGQLARRHGVRITLRPNPYGGITAIILIPHSVVAAEGITGQQPAKALESATQAPGRRATHGEKEEGGGGAEPVGSANRAAAAGPAGRWPGPETRLAEFPQPRMTDAWLQAGIPPAPDIAESGDTGAAGLPRRIRQASLAPQLRDMPLSAPPPSEPYPRSPENARSTMTAMQQGWERGRSLFEPAKPATAQDSQFAASAEHGYEAGRETASGQTPGPHFEPPPPPPGAGYEPPPPAGASFEPPPPPPGAGYEPPPPPPGASFEPPPLPGASFEPPPPPGTDVGTAPGTDIGTDPGSNYGPPADFGGPGDRVTGPADMDGTTDAAAYQHEAATEGRNPSEWS